MVLYRPNIWYLPPYIRIYLIIYLFGSKPLLIFTNPNTCGAQHCCSVPDVSANSNICVLKFQPIKIIRVLQYQPIKTRVKETEKPDSYRRTTQLRSAFCQKKKMHLASFGESKEYSAENAGLVTASTVFTCSQAAVLGRAIIRSMRRSNSLQACLVAGLLTESPALLSAPHLPRTHGWTSSSSLCATSSPSTPLNRSPAAAEAPLTVPWRRRPDLLDTGDDLDGAYDSDEQGKSVCFVFVPLVACNITAL